MLMDNLEAAREEVEGGQPVITVRELTVHLERHSVLHVAQMKKVDARSLGA